MMISAPALKESTGEMFGGENSPKNIKMTWGMHLSEKKTNKWLKKSTEMNWTRKFNKFHTGSQSQFELYWNG